MKNKPLESTSKKNAGDCLPTKISPWVVHAATDISRIIKPFTHTHTHTLSHKVKQYYAFTSGKNWKYRALNEGPTFFLLAV